MDVTDNTNSTGDSSGRTESSVKKTNIILTEMEQVFTSLFKSVVSKIDKRRKIDLQHVSDRCVSLKKQGGRKHDVTYFYTIVTPVIDYWKETIEVDGQTTKKSPKCQSPSISRLIGSVCVNLTNCQNNMVSTPPSHCVRTLPKPTIL